MSFNENAMSRANILKRLRAGRAPFEEVSAAPDAYLPVTRLEADESLVVRFGAELERLSGKLHLPASEADAITTILELIRAENTSKVMVWEALPLAGLAETLNEAGIQCLVPRTQGAGHAAALREADLIRVGVTGADAGFATTGTLALVTRPDQGRLASLLPPIHIAILRRERLYARLENWLTNEGRQALIESRSVAFVTGPSRTGDIEMKIVLGVHGPRVVHVVVV